MKRRRSIISIEFSTESTQELLGRQSVRTTFKLSERAITALSILAGQLGIKQKSLFDHLIDDTAALRKLAEESSEFELTTQRVAKTYVISRKSLENLEQVSQNFQTPRDTLVELSVERIFPLVYQEKEKHEKRKELLEQLDAYFEAGKKILEYAHDTLGAEDPAMRRIVQMMRNVQGCCEDVENCVERGRKIEDF